jgi:hypothetical protein
MEILNTPEAHLFEQYCSEMHWLEDQYESTEAAIGRPNLLELDDSEPLLTMANIDMVPRRGLEPPRLSALVPETSASTNSATWAVRR